MNTKYVYSNQPKPNGQMGENKKISLKNKHRQQINVNMRNYTHSTKIGKLLIDNIDVSVSILLDDFIEFCLNVVCIVAYV